MNNQSFAEVVTSINFLINSFFDNHNNSTVDEYTKCFNKHIKTVSFNEEELDDIVYVIFKNKLDSLSIKQKVNLRKTVESSISTHLYHDTLTYKHLLKIKEIL